VIDSVTLVTTSDSFEQRVRAALDGRLNGGLRTRKDAWAADTAQSAAHALLADDPHVLVFEPNGNIEHALGIAREIDERRQDVSVILVTDPTPDVWAGALRAGVRDVLATDASDDEVRAAIDAALERSMRVRTAAADEPVRMSRVITVVSPKGGAGKTAIATNLAVGLARQHPNDVVVVDLDLQFGDVDSALRLSPEYSMADVVRSLDSIDETTLKAYLTPHAAHLFVLCAPQSPAEYDDISPAQVGAVIDRLAETFTYVVIDTGAGLDESTLVALEHSTDFVVVCATDVANTRGVRKELEAFDLLGLITQRRHVVLNRADARVGVRVSDIEATIGSNVDVSIPSSRAVPMAMNQGSAVLEQDQRSPIGRAYLELVSRFAPTQAPRAGVSEPLVALPWRRRKESA
jgi:pilus assembly protein CpaE